MRSVKRALANERGATAVEYALIASLIAAVVAGIVTVMGGEVLGLFQMMVDLWP